MSRPACTHTLLHPATGHREEQQGGLQGPIPTLLPPQSRQAPSSAHLLSHAAALAAPRPAAPATLVSGAQLLHAPERQRGATKPLL